MLISKANLPDYLLSAGIFAPVKTIREIKSFRNKIFCINEELLIKNFKFNDRQNLSGFKNETRLLKKLSGSVISPQFIYADRYFPIVIMEYVTGYDKVFTSSNLERFLPLWQASLEAYSLDNPGKIYPWIFESETHSSQFSDEIDRELVARIKTLRKQYRFSTLVHGDLKYDNILTNGVSFKVIDWEFSAWGDEVWDIVYLSASLILSNSALTIFQDTVEFKNTSWFFILNEEQLSFLKFAYALFEKGETGVSRFISFLGLAILQRLLESKIGRSKYDHYDYYRGIARDLILRPRVYKKFFM